MATWNSATTPCVAQWVISSLIIKLKLTSREWYISTKSWICNNYHCCYHHPIMIVVILAIFVDTNNIYIFIHTYTHRYYINSYKLYTLVYTCVHTHIPTHIHILCVCVCVLMYARYRASFFPWLRLRLKLFIIGKKQLWWKMDVSTSLPTVYGYCTYCRLIGLRHFSTRIIVFSSVGLLSVNNIFLFNRQTTATASIWDFIF